MRSRATRTGRSATSTRCPSRAATPLFNSRWMRDMVTFYGRNIFLAETSTTSGGLDSLLAPARARQEGPGQGRQARSESAHTYFVTNGTSTSNKIVVQALTKPGDVVLIDRNCHKSHHYGLVLAGAHPVYLDAYKLPEFAMYGAVPLRTHQEDAAGPQGGRATRLGPDAAADQLHLRRHHLRPVPGHVGGAGDQAGHGLPLGRGLVRLRRGRDLRPGSGPPWWPRSDLQRPRVPMSTGRSTPGTSPTEPPSIPRTRRPGWTTG